MASLTLSVVMGLVITTLVTGQGDELTEENKNKLRSYGNWDPKCPYITRTDGRFHYYIVWNSQVYVFGAQECAAGTFWVPTSCQCVAPEIVPITYDPRAFSNVVPNAQATCGVLANISYNSATDKFDSATYVQMGSDAGKAKLNDIRVQGPAGSTGGFVVPLNGTSLVLHSFNGNQLLGPWKSSLRFKPSSDFQGNAVLLSDEGEKEKGNLTDPEKAKTLDISFSGTSITVFLRLGKDATTKTCNVQADANGWYLLEMTSINTDLAVAVNGQTCVSVDSGVALWMKYALKLGSSINKGSILLDYFRFFKNPQKCQN